MHTSLRTTAFLTALVAIILIVAFVVGTWSTVIPAIATLGLIGLVASIDDRREHTARRRVLRRERFKFVREMHAIATGTTPAEKP